MLFDVYGPLPVEFGDDNERWRAAFWNDVEDQQAEGLKLAIGCYAFCLRNGENSKPWYVGKTLAATGFEGEIFQPHKVSHFKNANEVNRGRREIFLFPLLTPEGRFSHALTAGQPSIDWLETTLIGMALAKNPRIANLQNTRMLRNIQVPGLCGETLPGRPTSAVAAVRSVFLDL